MKTILIQGAMESEISYLIEYFKPTITEVFAGFEFFVADFKDIKIIISQTQIGIISASESTTIAVLKYKPDIVINQGCAGASREDLSVGDIVIGESAVYINDFKTLIRENGMGSNALEWIPNEKRSYKISATEWILSLAKNFENDNIKIGCLGSGDLFSRECDRINYLRDCFGHYSEDMETVASYKVCQDFDIPHIAFRIISNNELLMTGKDKSTHQTIQKFTIDFVNYLIK